MQIAAIMLIVVICPSHIAQPVFVLILHCLLIHLMGSLVISLNAIARLPTFIIYPVCCRCKYFINPDFILIVKHPPQINFRSSYFSMMALFIDFVKVF